DSVNILVKSISATTLKQYSKPIRDWTSYCTSENIDIFNSNEEKVVEYLTSKFNNGVKYSSLNTIRSALSLICDKDLGKNPLISRLLKGAYNIQPARPKYDRIYSLDPVLEKLENLSPLNNLNLHQLTKKLVRSNIHKKNDGYEIEIPDRIKSSRQGAFQPLLIIPKFNNIINNNNNKQQ
ncbi:GSCOCG00012959001-RA-CDS, partial [Cotesia congregata]